MKITSLIENTTENQTLDCEHGLSLYIEAADKKILFDFGQTDLFCQNAEKLGIDLSKVDIAILSHGHYDHGGGISRFLEINKKAPVYISDFAFGKYYNGSEKYIGLDENLMGCERFIFTGDEYEIEKCLTLYSCNDKAQPISLGSFGLNKIENGNLIPDDFKHEQYLLIEEDGKRVLISGCSHKGIPNITQWFDVDAIIGGFHFSKLELSSLLEEYGRILSERNCTYYTCHCTGKEQFDFLKDRMQKLFYLSTGQTIEI